MTIEQEPTILPLRSRHNDKIQIQFRSQGINHLTSMSRASTKPGTEAGLMASLETSATTPKSAQIHPNVAMVIDTASNTSYDELQVSNNASGRPDLSLAPNHERNAAAAISPQRLTSLPSSVSPGYHSLHIGKHTSTPFGTVIKHQQSGDLVIDRIAEELDDVRVANSEVFDAVDEVQLLAQDPQLSRRRQTHRRHPAGDRLRRYCGTSLRGTLPPGTKATSTSRGRFSTDKLYRHKRTLYWHGRRQHFVLA